MSKVFNRGFETAKEENRKQEEARENAGKKLWRFFLKDDGDEADIRFLTEEPINFWEHSIKTYVNGKERYDTAICTMDGCPYCEDSKPSYKGAFLIYDMREYTFRDKDGKEQKRKGTVRLYVAGAKIVTQLDRLSKRYGLTSRVYTISRSGKGNSTSYMFDRSDDKSTLSPEEIKKILPEKLAESYDGTMDSLYDIVTEQLEMLVEGEDNDKSEDTSVPVDSSNFVDVPEMNPPFDEKEESESKPSAKKLFAKNHKKGVKLNAHR